jgi:DNA-binding PadR family transcriptional regulator
MGDESMIRMNTNPVKKRDNPLMIKESPLLFQPSLAKAVGVNEAIFLQQLYYLLNPDFNKNIIDGRTWVYNTLEQWGEKFNFWSHRTIERIIKSLEESGLLLSRYLSCDKRNRTKYYSIDDDVLERFRIDAFRQNGDITHRQNDEVHSAKMAGCIKEQEITLQKITTRDKKNAREGAFENDDDIASIDASVDIVGVGKLALKEKKTSKNLDAATLSDQFDEFWKIYPHRVAKQEAAKAFAAAVKKMSLASILEVLEAQKKYREKRESLALFNPSYPNPATWLNKERWNDEIKTDQELVSEAQAHMKPKLGVRQMVNIQGDIESKNLEKLALARASARAEERRRKRLEAEDEEGGQ